VNRRGIISVLFLFISIAFVFFLSGALRLCRRMAELEREQTITDTTALSVLRLRAKALQAIAERWETIGQNTGAADATGVFVPAARWTDLTEAAKQVSSSLSGYQSRLTGVVTVLCGAYGIERDDLVIDDNTAGKMGLLAQPLLIRDETGATNTIAGGWFKRTWTVDAKQNPAGVVRHSYRNASSSARLWWDVDRDDPDVRRAGNGGYPADWTQARAGAALDPHRYPFYRAELDDAP
jgi:hypothetical protein